MEELVGVCGLHRRVASDVRSNEGGPAGVVGTRAVHGCAEGSRTAAVSKQERSVTGQGRMVNTYLGGVPQRTRSLGILRGSCGARVVPPDDYSIVRLFVCDLTRKAATVGAAFALTAVVTLAACSDDNNAPTRVYLSGNYTVHRLLAGCYRATRRCSPVGPANRGPYHHELHHRHPGDRDASAAGTYEAFRRWHLYAGWHRHHLAAARPQDIQCTGTFTDVLHDVVHDRYHLSRHPHRDGARAGTDAAQ